MTSVMKRVSTGRHGGLITMKSLVIREWSLPMATAMASFTARLRVLGFSCVSEVSPERRKPAQLAMFDGLFYVRNEINELPSLGLA